jgi:type II restriction/modification system DNA methylase subunit YeeA
MTQAAQLSENRGVAFMGDTKGGAFDIPGVLARRWLEMSPNPNGRPNADVLRPWINGMDVTRRPSDTWIIDFGWTMSEEEAAYYVAPFAHVFTEVKPIRASNNRELYRRFWWRHVEPRPGMWRAISGVGRFIVTPEAAKHRTFTWSQTPTVPDHQLQVIVRDDDTTFGVLHSRHHLVWARALGSPYGSHPTARRYNISRTFDTYPFPDGLAPTIHASTFVSDRGAMDIAQASRELVAARDAWLNPPDLVERIPEVVPGFPDRIVPRNPKAAAVLKTRTLTNLYNTRGTPEGVWLDNLHRALDAAVAAAYGWPADLSDDEILSRLLDLNRARAAVGEVGRISREPDPPSGPDDLA